MKYKKFQSELSDTQVEDLEKGSDNSKTKTEVEDLEELKTSDSTKIILMQLNGTRIEFE